MAPNPFDYFAIQNTIAKCTIAIDTKNFDMLSDIFAPDVHATFPVLGAEPIKDAATFIRLIQSKLDPVITQHALTTQTIAISDDGGTAEATTYVTAVYFGTGKWEGYHFTAWVQYIDSLKLIAGKGALPGSSGQWVIAKRELVIIHREGKEAIMGT